MKDDFYPILVVPTVPIGGGIRFMHQDDAIDICGEITPTLWAIFAYCNGYNDLATISEKTKIELEEVCRIIGDLVQLEVIVDSREQYLHFHRISNFPSNFNCYLTQDEVYQYTGSPRLPVKTGTSYRFRNDFDSKLADLISKRRSCRNFSNKKLSLYQIGNICHFAYSIRDHAVPSGGALYPLRIYVLIENDQLNLPKGYYEYDAEKDRLVLFSKEVDEEQLKYCFNQETMPFGSSVQIIIAADLKRQTYKYSNRGYRLTLIEAGQAAENICLYCAEQGIATCEMGGVQDESLKMELGLPDEVYPLLAIPVGYCASNTAGTFDKIQFVEKFVGENKPVEKVWAKSFREHGTFFGATSVYRTEDGELQYAGATSPSYADAIFKASVEGYERWRSGKVRVDFRGPAALLGDWLNPNILAPLTEEQSRKCGLTPFSECLVIDWTLGKTFDGNSVYIPSDIVFYGQNDHENRIYYGHSSGIAAHTNFGEAKKRALVELIERDALMRNWYARTSPRRIGIEDLPVHAKKRTRYWQAQGRKLIVLQLPSRYGYVFETIFVSKTYPFFVSGAAATIDDGVDEAILKSLMEAEYNLLLCLRYPSQAELNPEEALTPTDHGKVYHIEKNAKTLSWLWAGEAGPIESRNFCEFSKLKEKLEIVTVDLSERNAPIKVVRVFSPKLAPINFGFHAAHYTHPELKVVHPESLKWPHYFA